MLCVRATPCETYETVEPSPVARIEIVHVDVDVDVGVDWAARTVSSLTRVTMLRMLTMLTMLRTELNSVKRKLGRDGGLSLATLRKARAFVSGLIKARVLLARIGGRGHGVRVNGRLVVRNDGRMTIGRDTVLRGIPTAVELATGPNGSLEIGTGAIINSGASICAYGDMVIGARALIGPHVMINDTSFHDLYDRSVVPDAINVVIEDDVWIGAKASILPGVRIGRGAVVSAHSLVNRDVEPFTIVSGVPAAQIAKLNPKKFVSPNSPAKTGDR